MVSRSFPRFRSGGFTLLDVMIAAIIVGILLAIALPTYGTSVRKSRRADGIQALRTLQLAQERYRSNHTTYGTLAQIGVSANSPGNWYTVAVSSPTASGYTATATARSGTTQVSDTANGISCSTLTVNQDAPVGQAACWGM